MFLRIMPYFYGKFGGFWLPTVYAKTMNKCAYLRIFMLFYAILLHIYKYFQARIYAQARWDRISPNFPRIAAKNRHIFDPVNGSFGQRSPLRLLFANTSRSPRSEQQHHALRHVRSRSDRNAHAARRLIHTRETLADHPKIRRLPQLNTTLLHFRKRGYSQIKRTARLFHN